VYHIFEAVCHEPKSRQSNRGPSTSRKAQRGKLTDLDGSWRMRCLWIKVENMKMTRLDVTRYTFREARDGPVRDEIPALLGRRRKQPRSALLSTQPELCNIQDPSAPSSPSNHPPNTCTPFPSPPLDLPPLSPLPPPSPCLCPCPLKPKRTHVGG
jgi:hypothetical protein